MGLEIADKGVKACRIQNQKGLYGGRLEWQ